jgi:hypothetical protein
MRALRVLSAVLLLGAAPGCAWCVDQCLGPPPKPIRDARPAKRPSPRLDPCELIPGSVYRSGAATLYFEPDYVEWRHDGEEEIFDWRCQRGHVQFREGHMATDLYVRDGGETLDWNGTLYTVERRTEDTEL